MTPISPCRLCDARKELQESHILPGFVFRWKKETSATGYMRFGQSPNLRVQDGVKLHLLCRDCEQRFNDWETQFANQIFHPMTQGKAERASYSSWLLQFCASVSWRVLVYFIDGKHLGHVPATLLPSVERAELTWREFLLGNRPRPQPQQHIWPLAGGLLESYTRSEMPTNINRYLFRTTDMSVASNDRDAFTYAKLGPFIIVGFIAMARPKQWVGTRVNTHGGTIIGPRDYTMPKEFWEFITVKADRAATLQERISEKQTAKIAETYKANLERAAESDSMRVMHQDVKLFGGRAFRRK
jgi:hypothetical protein